MGVRNLPKVLHGNVLAGSRTSHLRCASPTPYELSWRQSGRFLTHSVHNNDTRLICSSVYGICSTLKLCTLSVDTSSERIIRQRHITTLCHDSRMSAIVVTTIIVVVRKCTYYAKQRHVFITHADGSRVRVRRSSASVFLLSVILWFCLSAW